MSHGTTEIAPPLRDHTRDALRASWHAAHHLATYAEANLKDAERNVELARFALTAARARSEAARLELQAYESPRDAVLS